MSADSSRQRGSPPPRRRRPARGGGVARRPPAAARARRGATPAPQSVVDAGGARRRRHLRRRRRADHRPRREARMGSRPPAPRRTGTCATRRRARRVGEYLRGRAPRLTQSPPARPLVGAARVRRRASAPPSAARRAARDRAPHRNEDARLPAPRAIAERPSWPRRRNADGATAISARAVGARGARGAQQRGAEFDGGSRAASQSVAPSRRGAAPAVAAGPSFAVVGGGESWRRRGVALRQRRARLRCAISSSAASAARARVGFRMEDLEDPFLDLDERRARRRRADVDDDDERGAAVAAVEAVRDARRRRLVDDPEAVEPAGRRRRLHRGALAVSRVRRHAEHRRHFARRVRSAVEQPRERRAARGVEGVFGCAALLAGQRLDGGTEGGAERGAVAEHRRAQLRGAEVDADAASVNDSRLVLRLLARRLARLHDGSEGGDIKRRGGVGGGRERRCALP